MMFSGLRLFSAPRAISGIYWELRQLRRLMESYLVANDIPLPATPWERLREKLSSVAGADVVPPPMSEEQLAEDRARQIAVDLASGRDPGTDYRPW